tara:strand:- start:21621 stop:21926 length:306 start_codon:yes stop_codon:yes gene_type:complete
MKSRIAPLAFAALLASSASMAIDKLPQGEFACQVETRNNGAGLVLLQANNKQEAKEAAIGLPAFTRMEGTATAVEVKQCIVLPNERFADGAFQQFFDELPL